MFTRYIFRGMKAGVVGGLAFGLFVALVGNPFIGYAETFEEGGHGHGPVVSGAVTTGVSIVGGVLVGMLLGAVVLGVGYYFLEPAIPGEGGSKSYLLATAGFVTVSGAPWLILPPQPPGVEQSLAVGTRLAVYAVMMVAGAVACGLAGYVYNQSRARAGRLTAVAGALVPLGLLLVVAFLMPVNAVSGPIPSDLAAVFRTVVGVGQAGLWLALASAHAWLVGRERVSTSQDDQFTGVSRSPTTD